MNYMKGKAEWQLEVKPTDPLKFCKNCLQKNYDIMVEREDGYNIMNCKE